MQALCKDARMLPAGGAPEIELCQQLHKFGRKETGLDQYAIAKYAESLEVRDSGFITACKGAMCTLQTVIRWLSKLRQFAPYERHYASLYCAANSCLQTC